MISIWEYQEGLQVAAKTQGELAERPLSDKRFQSTFTLGH
jgi:hypothetical protein